MSRNIFKQAIFLDKMSRRNVEVSYSHWYNFEVPESRRSEFVRLVNEDMTPDTQVLSSEEGDRCIFDIVFTTPSKKRPGYIGRLLKRFDGVDVYQTKTRMARTR